MSNPIEDKIKERTRLCAAIQNDIVSLSTKIASLSAKDLDLYLMLQGPDCLFNDSPISPFKTAHWIKEFMIKRDMDFIGAVLDGKFQVRPFIERMEDASAWCMRFTKEKPKPKTGLEAIMKEA